MGSRTSVTRVPQNWQLTIANWCISTILALLGIAVSVSNRQQIEILRLVSITLGVAAIVFLSIALVRALMLVRRLPLGQRQLPSLRVGVHSSRWAASAQDVLDAHQFLESFLRDDPPSLALMRALHRRNPLSIRLIERNLNNHRELVGMVIIAPLNSRAVKDFLDKRIIDLSNVRVEDHVPKSWQRPRGMYIGGIAGKNSAGRAWALSFVEWLAQQSGVRHVFARPASRDGFRVLKTSGFLPVGEPSPFWNIELPV